MVQLPFLDDFGPTRGTALLFFHGFPGSHLQGRIFTNVVNTFNLRVLSPDRPGYGNSPGREKSTLTDFLSELERALDLKNVGQFYVVGASGGNPAAVSAAKYFGPRVLALGSICGLGPYEETKDLLSPFARRGFEMAKRTPDPVMRMILNPLIKNFTPEQALSSMMQRLDPVDRDSISDPETQKTLLSSIQLARKQGPAGIMFDLRTFVRPWPGTLAEVRCPYILWHGERDRILPVEMSRYMHAQVPHSRLKIYAQDGHYSLPLLRAGEIVRDLFESKT